MQLLNAVLRIYKAKMCRNSCIGFLKERIYSITFFGLKQTIFHKSAVIKFQKRYPELTPTEYLIQRLEIYLIKFSMINYVMTGNIVPSQLRRDFLMVGNDRSDNICIIGFPILPLREDLTVFVYSEKQFQLKS